MASINEIKPTRVHALIVLFAILTSPLRAWSEPPLLDNWSDVAMNECVLDIHLNDHERGVEHALQNLEITAEELKNSYKRLADDQLALRRLKDEFAELTRRLMAGERITIQDAQRAAQLPGLISNLEAAIQRTLQRSTDLTRHMYNLAEALRSAMKSYTKSCKKCPPSGDFLDGIKRRFRGMFRGLKCSVLGLLFSVGAGVAANAQSSDEDISMCGVLDSNPSECGEQDGRNSQCISAGAELTDALMQFDTNNCTRDFGDPLQCSLCDGWGEGGRRSRFQKCKELDEKVRKLAQVISDFC
jgi:hypothetical protein